MNAPGPASPGKPLSVLIVEDREDDLLLLLYELERGGYAVTHRRVETVAAFRAELLRGGWDMVISDFSLPTMTALDVLKTLGSVAPDLPCIVMSGTIAEESAVEVLRGGARDFVVKERMTRLLPAIERELREARERRRRHEAEANLDDTRLRMQFALDSVNIGTWETEIATGATIWSEVMARLHGIDADAFAGTFDAFLALAHPDDRRKVREALQRVNPVGSDMRVEYRTVWPDDSVHWIVVIGRTFFDRDGKPLRAVGVSMDVTAQRRLEEQFRQAQKMESIGNLAGGIAHDFNNLLTVVIGSCDLVAAAPAAAHPAIAEPLEEIRAAAVSATALTRQLLMFSRRQVVSPRVLDLNEVVKGFGKVLRRLVEENVMIDFALAQRLPLVRVDPAEVEQVLLNLVANARDAMRDGGTVKVETKAVTVPANGSGTPMDVPPGNYTVLSVSDSGEGMTPEVRMRLFEPFFTTKPVGRGTGLGLPTVYGIVKQSDGSIVVRSEPGAGATFEIYWPAVAAAAARPENATKEESGTANGRETILVVEDSDPLRVLNERILKKHGYVVLTAADGAKARAICETHATPIHIALIDVVMPGDSGPMVGQWIMEHRPETKLIYMSGYTGDTVDYQRVPDDRSTFLQKPFDAAHLVRVIREALVR